MEPEDTSLCPICKEHRENADHNNSVNHRFYFMKWAYNEYRKALVKDRHGIVLEVTEEVRNNYNFNFNNHKNRGKYVLKVTPEQLQLHDNLVTFNCKIKNTRKDSIYIVNISLLHSYNYFHIIHSNNVAENEGTFLQLQPGSHYTFQVVFSTQILTSASYKIPLACDFQTVDNKQSFTIVRTFLAIVDEQTEKNEEKIKSPFTSKPWSDVEKIIPTTKEIHYVDHYSIPPKYAKLLKHGLRPFDKMTSAEENDLRELNQLVQRLTKDNYSKFWHILLWMEEKAQGLMLTKFNMEEVTMNIINDKVLVLEVPGLAEKRPSVIVGDFIRIRITGDHTAYKGFVNKVNEKTVEILHVEEELMDCIRTDPGTKLDVSFILSRLAFERMHQGVDRVVRTGMVATLFPRINVRRNSNIIHELRDSDFCNREIIHNFEQKNAVLKILNSVQALPYIVFGPPGTGKTVTIVEAILQIKKHTKKRILVCAPANSACDVLALKLMPYCTKDELIRIHSTTRERNTITKDLMEYSNVEDDEFTKVEMKKLLSYKIVVTTLTLIGRFQRDYNPDCVFVDEAAQASEPETDIAIGLLSVGKQVVLAGDPKQLGPMVTDCAAKLGLGISLLERLMNYEVYKPDASTKAYDSNFITMLKLNFRSHPNILLIPNQLFYDNNLEARSALAKMDPIVETAIFPKIRKNYIRKKNQKSSEEQPGQAIEFYSLSSKEKREGSSPSYFNLMEAKMVVKYVKALISLNLGSQHKVTVEQIGVVTPYKRQVHKIKENLRFNGFEGVEVGTTESFQGREKRIIIISTVRAQHSLLLHDRKYNLGFVKHDQRFNVAVTRAISKLIVIGCPLVLTRDDKWGMYIKLCKDYNTYFGNQFENNNDQFKEEVIRRMKRFQMKDDQYNQ